MSAAPFHRTFVRVALVFSLAQATLSCRDATEITLHVHTNVPCTDPAKWKGVAVYVGAPGSASEDNAPVLTTTQCDADGSVGTLVVVPSGSKDAEVALRIVAGVDVKPEDCAAHHYNGCIVVRRTVRFNAHENLDLDLQLTSDCVDKSCDDAHTCVDGACVDAETATTSVDPGLNSVRCGDNGIRCPTSGNVCCLSVDYAMQTTSGECMPAELCPKTSAVLNCDDAGDCPLQADGQPRNCSLFYTTIPGSPNGHYPYQVQVSECLPFQSGVIELCNRGSICKGAGLEFACHPSVGYPDNALPGYTWCDD